jgi:hypothetical protein
MGMELVYVYEQDGISCYAFLKICFNFKDMKKFILFTMIACCGFTAVAQSPKIELYDLIKKLLTDSTGYENVGEWPVSEPKKIPIKWKEDRVIMSEDTSINFYRSGTVNISINGKTFMQAGQPVKWNIMLKGPRMGYTNFSIISSPPSNSVHPKYTPDSLFGKKPFTAKLIRSCDTKSYAGYYYYELKLPKKDIAYLKISWITVNDNSAVRIDCYDAFSKYAVKLECAK